MPEPRAGPHSAGHVRITARQRERLLDAVLAGIGRLLASASALRDAAASPGAPEASGLLAVAGGLYTYAFEEYGKLLLIASLPEKGGVVSVPYKEIFRSHEKKFEAARRALPKECWSAETGLYDPGLYDPGLYDIWNALDATFPTRMSMLYVDMDRSGEPSAAIPAGARLLGNALSGMERAVGDREARNRQAGAGVEARAGRAAE